MSSLILWVIFIPLLAVLASIFIKTNHDESMVYATNFQFLGLWIGFIELGFTLYFLIIIISKHIQHVLLINIHIHLWNGIPVIFAVDYISILFMILGAVLFFIWFVGSFYMPKNRVKPYVLTLLFFESLYMALIFVDDAILLSSLFFVLCSGLILFFSLWSVRLKSNTYRIFITWSILLCFCLIFIFSFNIALLHTFRFQDYVYRLDRFMIYTQFSVGMYFYILIPSLLFICTLLPFWPFHFWHKQIATIIGSQHALLFSSLFIIIGLYIVFRWIIPLAFDPYSVINQHLISQDFLVYVHHGIRYYAALSSLIFLGYAWYYRKETISFILYLFYAQISYLVVFLLSKDVVMGFGTVLVMVSHIIAFNILILMFIMLSFQKGGMSKSFFYKVVYGTWRVKVIVLFFMIIVNVVPMSMGFTGYLFILYRLIPSHLGWLILTIVMFLGFLGFYRNFFSTMLLKNPEKTLAGEYDDLSVLEFVFLLCCFLPILLWGFIPASWMMHFPQNYHMIFQR